VVERGRRNSGRIQDMSGTERGRDSKKGPGPGSIARRKVINPSDAKKRFSRKGSLPRSDQEGGGGGLNKPVVTSRRENEERILLRGESKA